MKESIKIIAEFRKRLALISSCRRLFVAGGVRDAHTGTIDSDVGLCEVVEELFKWLEQTGADGRVDRINACRRLVLSSTVSSEFIRLLHKVESVLSNLAFPRSLRFIPEIRGWRVFSITPRPLLRIDCLWNLHRQRSGRGYSANSGKRRQSKMAPINEAILFRHNDFWGSYCISLVYYSSLLVSGFKE